MLHSMYPKRALANHEEGLVGFTVVLRNAGLAITTDRVATFLGALDSLDVTSRVQTYWASPDGAEMDGALAGPAPQRQYLV